MSEWTVDTLKEHFEALLLERDRKIDANMDSAEKAVTKAEAATEKRFEGVNEFRQTLTDQASTFVSRVEFNALKERVDRSEGAAAGAGSVRQAMPVIIGVVVAAIGVAVAAASLIWG